MKNIPLHGCWMALVDDEDYPMLSKHKWHVINSCNKKSIRQQLYPATLSPPKGYCADHINGDTMDNRRENLRIVTRHQNLMNSIGNISRRKSKYKCVNFEKRRNVWRAYIRKEGRYKHLGYYKSEEEATIVYDKNAKKIYGKYARLNFPE